MEPLDKTTQADNLDNLPHNPRLSDDEMFVFTPTDRFSSQNSLFTGLDDQSVIKESARMAHRRQQLDESLADVQIDDQVVDIDYAESNRMSISSLLNPISTSKSQRAPGDVDVACEFEVSLLNANGELDASVLIGMRRKHDSEVGRKKGNERKRPTQAQKQVVSEGDVEKLDPAECSKMVSMLVKSAEGLEKTIARLHRWNIHGPLTLHRLIKNTSTQLTMPLQTLFQHGEVSPENRMEPGKFVVVIKNNTLYVGKILAIFSFTHGRHDWKLSSDTRKDISYLALELFFYDSAKSNRQMIASYREATPQRRTYSLCDCANVHFLFPISNPQNIFELETGSGSIVLSSVVRDMLLIMSQPGYIQDFEAELAGQKSKKRARTKDNNVVN